MSIDCRYGFRILGNCRNDRRLVDASLAFSSYCHCDERAQVLKEGYLSAFRFGNEFRERDNGFHLDVRNYRGLCYSPWIWWDIDRDNDLNAAVISARKLASSLVDRYGIDDDDLLIFFSGSKGFHLGLPTKLWNPDPSEQFNLFARRFAENAAGRIGEKIDPAIYDKVRAFRAPNSKHPKTSLHKKRLLFDELMYLNVSAIAKHASTPEPFEISCNGIPFNKQASEDWLEAVGQLKVELSEHEKYRTISNGTTALNRLTLEFIRDGATNGNRHRLLFSSAANLAELGCPPALAHALLSESALDSGLPPSEVKRQIDCGLESIVKNGNSR